MRKALLVLPAVMTSVLLIPVAASADTVGVPGTPNCFGQRVSHGSSDHKLTPKQRATFLQEFVDSGDPFAKELFGDEVTVGEFAWWVRTNCSDNPIFG